MKDIKEATISNIEKIHSTKMEEVANKPINKFNPNTIAEIAGLLTKVTKYTGTTIVIMGGLVLMVKLGKVMLKDMKSIGI